MIRSQTNRRSYRSCLPLVMLTLLTACGGGGGSSAPSQPMGVTPPPSGASNEDPVETLFRDSTRELGLSYILQDDESTLVGKEGGLALVDIDNDGSLELYVAHGKTEPGKLFTFDGTRFNELENRNGIAIEGIDAAGYFVDLDADGWKDFVSVQVQSIETFRNDGTGHFVNSTDETDLQHRVRMTYSMAASDFDLDGDIDLFFAHWGEVLPDDGSLTQYLWQNDGLGRFTDISANVPIEGSVVGSRSTERSFTPTFADINSDGYPDLLLAGENRSQVLLNVNGTHFNEMTTDVISEEFGMGGTVADYDNDGDLDWFVSSIFSENSVSSGFEITQGATGNRLYRNDGGGLFSDVTDAAGVRDGGWGWGSCFADFNNDGHMDLFHTNGWAAEFEHDASRLFMSNGDGTFTEQAQELGIDHTGQGRGVVCADYNSDGKIDIFIANHGASPTVYTNENNNGNHFLQINLEGKGANPDAIGARVTVTTASGSQMQESQLGSWYLSQGPGTLHFGLGEDDEVMTIDIVWPGPGRISSRIQNIAVDQLVEFEQPDQTGLSLNIVQGEGNGVYDAGDIIDIQAESVPDGYFFSHWSSSGAGSFADATLSDTTFTMPNAPVALTANFVPGVSPGQPVSVARRWSEVLLQAIRKDFARPTVHARNLFHVSSAMYDAWSAYSEVSTPWLLGTSALATCEFSGSTALDTEAGNIESSRQQAISFAAYRIIRHRFANSPGAIQIARDAEALMSSLGYNISIDSTDYTSGSSAALGNHIAECYIEFGFNDGANEQNGYANTSYEPVNSALEPALPGNPNITDLNHWQPLSLVEFIDQAGNPVSQVPEFLGPEWGQVIPFALSQDDLTIYERDGFDYWVYFDPGMPPTIDGVLSDNYKYTFSLVSVWSSHLDPDDGVMVDISPASLGNIESYPTLFEDYANFYNTLEGGDPSRGYDINPATGAPYTPQLVPRGDYTRVLAEFWADGPDSETPPGHWFVILNEVNEHDLLQRRFGGQSEELGLLEWDIKAYFLMGGAMHDAAITAWGIKGWYDYIRPISSLRAMADLGQGSDTGQPSYHIDGIPLIEGYIELVAENDPLVGEDREHLNKIKLLAWKGPDFIDDPKTANAGVDWILAENWWPYQRPTFVTPPFAGYISGHSTYSRAAAEVMTALTGDAYFPGGMSSFDITANEFLVFEDGPSMDITLQWATYRDASDQCSLSRIWGGIHPPADDIPGRLIGNDIGLDAFVLAGEYFSGSVP